MPLREYRGVFVTGTDTGVGKTVVSCALLHALRHRGIDPGAMKPIETGVGPDGPLDAIVLRNAAGVDDDLDEVCPIQLSVPAAPSVAAAEQGASIDLSRIDACFETLAARHRIVVVEGAGGLLVPLSKTVDMAGLAARLGLPILLVARSTLGTINHTRLALEAIARRGLELAGVVVSHSNGLLSAADAANLEALREELGGRLLGEILALPPDAAPPRDAIDVDRLLGALGFAAAG